MKPTSANLLDCPLTPALIELLQVSVTHATTKTSELAAFLCKSPATINKQFEQICALLNIHSRFSAVLTALKKGWIVLDASLGSAGGENSSEFS